MAVQVTIKLTKTDNKDWPFELPEFDYAISQGELRGGWERSEWNMPSNQEAVLVKTFPNMIEANKFIIRNIVTDYDGHDAATAMVKTYSNWSEQVSTQEV